MNADLGTHGWKLKSEPVSSGALFSTLAFQKILNIYNLLIKLLGF